MCGELDVLRLRILLIFLREDGNSTVMGISRTLQTAKQTISRIIIGMEKDGWIDRNCPRHPILTPKGREQAAFYEKRVKISLDFLTGQGIPLQKAREDAYLWAIYNTEETMNVLEKMETINQMKKEVFLPHKFNGAVLGEKMKDGEYSFPFVVYQENLSEKSLMDRTNYFFEQPCKLSIKNGKGTIQLKENRKGMDVLEVRKVKYMEEGYEIHAEHSGLFLMFPISAVQFTAMGEGNEKIFSGMFPMKIEWREKGKNFHEKVIFTCTV